MAGDSVLGAALEQAPDLGASEQPQAVETPTEETSVIDEPEAQQEIAEGAESEAGADELAVTKFTDLKKLFGDDVTEEDLYALELVSGTDGESYTVGQLKDMLQQRQDFDSQRKAFDAERQKAAEQIEQMKQQALLSTQTVQQAPDELRQAEAEMLAIQQQAQAQDWAELERDDPGQAALLRQKYNEAYGSASAKRDQLQSTWQQQQTEAQHQYIARQREALLQAKPEWRDQQVFNTDFQRMASAVQDIGITSDDLKTIVDPRIALLIDKYSSLKSQMDGAKANEKQVRERGKRVLRVPQGATGKLSRTQQVISNAKRPDATKQDKFAAEREIAARLGII